MPDSSTLSKHSPHLERMLRFLDQDPKNLRLLDDAAAAAFDAHALDIAADLIERHAVIEPLPATMANLKGLVAIARKKPEEAVAAFEGLRKTDADDPGLRFNLAWAKAMLGAYQDANDLLNDAAIEVSPRAPELKIRLMHHLGLYEEGLACGEALAERYPGNHALMGTLATLALDAEKPDAALKYAKLAGDHDEGRAALGLFALNEHDIPQSLDLFEQAINQQPNNPRAWVGKGLALLATGHTAEGADAIDKGAALFGEHLGSWIASGWAHFVGGNTAKARESFERALALDPNFAESHGGLAVLDILEGNMESARQRSTVALRLDKNCFGAALAKSLLLEKSGHAQAAQKIREVAMSLPAGPNGQTIAQALAGLGFTQKRPGKLH